jgi:hypothetical protein
MPAASGHQAAGFSRCGNGIHQFRIALEIALVDGRSTSSSRGLLSLSIPRRISFLKNIHAFKRSALQEFTFIRFITVRFRTTTIHFRTLAWDELFRKCKQ